MLLHSAEIEHGHPRVAGRVGVVNGRAASGTKMLGRIICSRIGAEVGLTRDLDSISHYYYVAGERSPIDASAQRAVATDDLNGVAASVRNFATSTRTVHRDLVGL